MKTIYYTIQDALGIHARPAGLLVKEAKKFSSRIMLSGNGKQAEATKLMMIMQMGIKQGMELTITVDGVDEDQAAWAMKSFFEENL